MFYNAELQTPYTIESLQKQFNHENIKKTVKEILGYIVLAMNKYNTDWTVYIIKTEEDADNIVFVEDEDELLASTDYKDIFSHYLHQTGAEVYMERFERFMEHYEIPLSTKN
ncbi:MAG: hypothetical protein AABZ74_09420 [Cyanobacteriota bacterium]